VFAVVEYFTGLGTKIFGTWGFDPIIADEHDVNRALEIAGYVGIMLCGAFPLVYLLKKWLAKPLDAFGSKVGLSADTTAGVLAAAANAIALFAMIEKMKPEDKVYTLAFSVCGAFLIGDHLAFTANFQPTLILPILVGKLFAGLLAIYLAKILVIPKMMKQV
jgi:ethanolamine transporter